MVCPLLCPLCLRSPLDVASGHWLKSEGRVWALVSLQPQWHGPRHICTACAPPPPAHRILFSLLRVSLYIFKFSFQRYYQWLMRLTLRIFFLKIVYFSKNTYIFYIFFKVNFKELKRNNSALSMECLGFFYLPNMVCFPPRTRLAVNISQALT